MFDVDVFCSAFAREGSILKPRPTLHEFFSTQQHFETVAQDASRLDDVYDRNLHLTRLEDVHGKIDVRSHYGNLRVLRVVILKS